MYFVFFSFSFFFFLLLFYFHFNITQSRLNVYHAFVTSSFSNEMIASRRMKEIPKRKDLFETFTCYEIKLAENRTTNLNNLCNWSKKEKKNFCFSILHEIDLMGNNLLKKRKHSMKIERDVIHDFHFGIFMQLQKMIKYVPFDASAFHTFGQNFFLHLHFPYEFLYFLPYLLRLYIFLNVSSMPESFESMSSEFIIFISVWHAFSHQFQSLTKHTKKTCNSIVL